MFKRLVLTTSLILWGFAGTTVANASQWNKRTIKQALICIHQGEGSWTSNTGNGYYGGLQMDDSFERTYGLSFYRKWGHSNNWPTWAQLEVGIRGTIARRGFNPWPNTSRICGLPYYF